MPLCKNRPEGFGPKSALHSRLPTTCFIDVIIVPIATWIYVVLLLIVLAPIYYRNRSSNSRNHKLSNDGGSGKRSLAYRILAFLYYLLIVAMMAMVSLEIARLSVAELGIGLLPFTYVGLLCAGAVHLLAGSKLARMLNVLYWAMLATVMAVKVATEATEGATSRNGKFPVDQYKMVDEITDVSVMIGVEVVLGLLEFVGWQHLA